MGPKRGLGLGLLTAGVLVGTLTVDSGTSVLGAGPPCRVRNVSQETFGRSLIRMVEHARDDDRLREARSSSFATSWSPGEPA